MPIPSEPTPQGKWIEQIAAKYFSIWIWSIVIGITTSTSISLVNYFPRARGPMLVVLLAPLAAFSAFFTLAAWYSVIRVLEKYILPTFFGSEEVVPVDPHVAKRLLAVAVRFSLLALTFRLLLSIADLALSSNF